MAAEKFSACSSKSQEVLHLQRIFIISDYRLLETNVIDTKLYLGKVHLLISASSIAVTTDPCYSQLVL